MPASLQLRTAIGPQPRKFADAVVRAYEVARAMRVVRAVVRGEAVIAGCDVGRNGVRDQRLHLPCLSADGVEERFGLLEHIVQLEQGVEIEPLPIVDIGPVQGHHRGIAHVQPRAAQHAKLERRVEDEDVLQPGGGLDLDQPPSAVRQALDHVGAGEQALMNEGCLEQGGGGVFLDDLARLRQRVGDMPVILGDEVTVRVTLAGQLADFVPGLEDRLERVIRLGGQIPRVVVVPEPEMALGAGEEAGLGESGGVGHGGDLQRIEMSIVSLPLSSHSWSTMLHVRSDRTRS